MKLPMREKYLDEMMPTWVGWPCGDGTWDIVHEDDILHNVFRQVPEKLAAEIIDLQNKFKKDLANLCVLKG